MLDCNTTSRSALNSSGHCCCQCACKEWIFWIIFKVSSTQRISVNIQSRCKPEINMKFFHLCRNLPSKLFHQFFVPGLCKCCSYRKCSTILIVTFCALMVFSSNKITIFKWTKHTCSINCIFLTVYFISLLQANSGRSVCHDQRWDSVLIKQCFTRLSCCSRHFNSRCSKCTSDFRHISIHKWNQIFYRNLRFFWKSAYFLFFCLWFKWYVRKFLKQCCPFFCASA